MPVHPTASGRATQRKYKDARGLTGEQLADAQRLNREWLKRRIKSGDRIYDIGVPEGSADLGDFYREELMHVGENMTPVFRGKFDIGSEVVDSWEWVLK
jgi:methylphosphotriester-DNA--protein-cysteine methyltransferase